MKSHEKSDEYIRESGIPIENDWLPVLFCAEGTAHSCHGNSQSDFIPMAGLLINKLDPMNYNNDLWSEESLQKQRRSQIWWKLSTKLLALKHGMLL